MIPPLGLTTVFTLHLLSPPTPNTNTKGSAWWYGPRGRAASTRAPASCKTLSCSEPSQSWQPSFHVIQHVDWSCFYVWYCSQNPRGLPGALLYFFPVFFGGVGQGQGGVIDQSLWDPAICLLLFIYLFIFGCAGSLLSCTLSSSCREWGLLPSCSRQLFIVVASLVAELRFYVHQLSRQHMDSVVAVPRL